MDFEVGVHRVAQRFVPQRVNGGYPPLVVYYHRFPAFLTTEDWKPELPLRAHPALLEAAKKIGVMADFIVITSNFVHLFQAEIEQASGCQVLSMIDTTLAEVQRRQWRRVGVLGFGDPVVYTRPLGTVGLATETIAGDLRDCLDGAIHEVMEGRVKADSAGAARQAVDELGARGVDGIILGCTEIPLLLGDGASAADLVNPLELLAHAAVTCALQP